MSPEATGAEDNSSPEWLFVGSESAFAAAAWRRRGGLAWRGRLARDGALEAGCVSGDSAVEADRVGSSVMSKFGWGIAPRDFKVGENQFCGRP